MVARKYPYVRKLEGNPGHRPIPTDEVAGVGTPEPAAHLTPAQLERWHDIVESLPVGLLSRTDNQSLERMAIAWTTFRETSEKINRSGLLVSDKEGNTVRNPLLLIRKQAADEMQICGMLLGLSPYARTRLKQPEGASDEALDILMSKTWQVENDNKPDKAN